MSTLVLLDPDLSFFEIIEDPDQLASDLPSDLQSDQNSHCYPLKVDRIKLGWSVVHKNVKHDKG